MRNCSAHNIEPSSRICPAPPQGGNGVIRGTTRRRHAGSQFLMLQNPHRSQPEVHHAASKTGAVPVGTKKLAQQAQKRRILGVLSVQGELFRAHTHHQATQGELFAHKAQQHGDIETTNTTAHPQQGSLETCITSAPEKCTKNTHFTPAKAMAVSDNRLAGLQGQAAVPAGSGRTQMRYPWAVAGPGRASRRRTEQHQHTRPHWCGGRRRDRRARAGFEARRRTK